MVIDSIAVPVFAVWLNLTNTVSEWIRDEVPYLNGDGDGHADDYHQVSFVGEPGLDMGGLTKEWFQVLKTFSSFLRQIFTKSEHDTDTFKTKLQNK